MCSGIGKVWLPWSDGKVSVLRKPGEVGGVTPAGYPQVRMFILRATGSHCSELSKGDEGGPDLCFFILSLCLWCGGWTGIVGKHEFSD